MTTPVTTGEDAASTPTCRVSPVIALLEEPRLSIPDYQRAYAWGPLQVRDLVEDVRHFASSGPYRIGTVILHRRREGDDEVLDVVDGQQRLTTLHLLARLLRQRLPSSELLAADSTSLAPWRFSPYGVEQSTAQVRANADAVRELLRGWSDDEVADFVEALVDRCEVVVIELTRLDEAFQMFDSQNSRGRELYPTDLLKAYHLREARGERADPAEMHRMVGLWESIPPAHVNALFADYLFPIRRWAYGRSVPKSGFGVQHLEEFKGIRAGDPANAHNNWAKAFVYAKNFADDHRAENATVTRFRVMQPVEYPHQIDQPVLNGETFFEMVDHYYRLGVELDLLAFHAGGRARSAQVDERRRPAVLQTLDRHSSPGSPQRWRYAYVRQLLDAALLYYRDRLGAQEWDAFAMLAGRFAMVPRAVRYAVRRETIDDHARSEDHLFQRIRTARSARDVLAHRVERPGLYGEGKGRVNPVDRDVVAQLWDLTEEATE